MAPLVKEFQKHTNEFYTKVCVTAQHREMLDQVLDLFQIVPDYDLNIMKVGQDLYDVTLRVMLDMRDLLIDIKPDVLLVHGDTTTSMAAALAAFYKQIPVGHVEAGLRTYNIYSPWPEEMNRQITDRLTTYHFAPTSLSKQNLINEGVNEENILVTGNTVIDALYWVIEKMKADQSFDKTVTKKLINFGLPEKKLKSWQSKFNKRKLVLITGHRRENFGQGFINICKAIKELAEKYPDVDFVYPMHLNPHVRHAITQVFKEIENQKKTKCNTYFIEPIDYLSFVYLMNASYMVLTDSGGIQEEAPGLGKPVLVMRNTTERPEALDAGTVRLVGTEKQSIIDEVTFLIEDEKHYMVMSKANNPYGDGHACERIVNKLLFNES